MLEFSVPRLLTGDNQHAAPLQEVMPALERAWGDASRVVAWQETVRQAAIMRLDLVRDFTALGGAAEQHLAGLSRLPAARATTVAYHSPDGPGVETVYRKTKRWSARLYVRDALPAMKTRGGGPDQTVRFELQLRSTMLREQSIHTVGELDDRGLAGLAWRHFERSRFQVPVGDPEAKLRRALDAMSDSTPGDRRGVLGQLQLDAVGATCSPRDKTVQKYRRMAAELGLCPSDVLQGVVVQPLALRALHYEDGTLAPLPDAA